MAPFVLLGTLLNHLFGASVGREGTALEMGGSIADQFTGLFRLKDEDRHRLLMAGLAAGFASVFGTPLAGARRLRAKVTGGPEPGLPGVDGLLPSPVSPASRSRPRAVCGGVYSNMGFFDLFLPSKDPAHDWEAMPGLPLECSLDEPSLNGVRLGDAAEVLSRFGPPENRRPTRDDRYDHPSRGFEIDTTGGRIDGLVFYWNAPDPATHFKGTFTWGGRPLKLDAWAEERDVRNAFGEPYWIDDDENEKIFFYEFPQKSLEWQVEFRRGRLTVFILVTPSLLSDPVQREGYRVTRPWPPLT